MSTSTWMISAPATFPTLPVAWPSAALERHPRIQGLAGSFFPVGLDALGDAALLDRIDIKFVMTTRQLQQALGGMQPYYWMLSVKGRRLNHYRTLYFDTPDFALYRAHANDRAERYKVRSREYTDTRLSFLEVKHRTRKDRTVKERLFTPQPVITLTPPMDAWLQEVSPLDGQRLQPVLWNTFTRMTLVSKTSCERVTLDIDLAFSADDRSMHLDGLAVAEVKVPGAHCESPFEERLRAMRIHPRGFSKYAVGVAMLYDGVKKNAIKPKMLWLEKMMKGSDIHE
jgi:hypothetical protein